MECIKIEIEDLSSISEQMKRFLSVLATDVYEQPKAAKKTASKPKVVEVKIEEPKAEEPKAEEPKAEEPKAEEPKAEEPKAEEPKAEEPKAEEPKAEAVMAEITISDVRNVLGQKVNEFRDEIKAKLNELGAPSVTKLDPSKYEELYDYISSL